MTLKHAHSAGLDGDLQCEADMAEEFESLLQQGIMRGWSADEVANAILSLAQGHVLSMRAEGPGEPARLQ